MITKSMSTSSPIGSAKPVSDPSKVGFPILISYHYLRGWSNEHKSYILSGKAKRDGFEIMLDSGAFSAKNCGAEIKLAEYMDFLQEHGRHFEGGYVALDVLGEPKQTSVNLNTMFGEGLTPMPVHVWGDDDKKMDELFELSEKVCLGGFKRPNRGSAPKEYVVQKMRWAKGRDVHWLGHCRQKHITSMLPHSCDSTSWQSARRFGVASVYVGGGRMLKIHRNDRNTYQINHEVLDKFLCDAGVSRTEFRDTKGWVGEDGVHNKVTTLSWVRYSHELRKRFGVRYCLALNLLIEVHRFLTIIQKEKGRREASVFNSN